MSFARNAAISRSGASVRTFKHCLALVIGAIVFVAAGGCEGQSAARPAPTRPPDVRYEPTPHNVVAAMLQLAQVGEKDVLYDLGCGDGRIVIAAVQRLGARGVCVDIDPQRIRESRANAERAGVADRIDFLEQDLFATDLGDATVVTLFLSPQLNLKVRPKLWRELHPGARVVSYVHDMDDWQPRQVENVQGVHGPRQIYLWRISADDATRAGFAGWLKKATRTDLDQPFSPAAHAQQPRGSRVVGREGLEPQLER